MNTRTEPTTLKVIKHTTRLVLPKPKAERVDMSGRAVIVTGASKRSLGYETAKTLAVWGAQVIVTCLHDVDVLQRSLRADVARSGGDGRTVSAHVMDLCDIDSVRAFVEWYLERFGRELHVLINNAGIHRNIFEPKHEPPRSRHDIEIHWRTNFLGTFHLTNALLPLLQDSGLACGDVRVINVASHLHDSVPNDAMFHDLEPYNSWKAYGRSKLGLVHMAMELQRRYGSDFGLRAVALHPGSASTNLTHPISNDDGFVRFLKDLSLPLESLVLLSAFQGAQTSIHCATTAMLEGGKYYERCAVSQPSLSACESNISSRLWQTSERWLETAERESRGRTRI